MKRFACQNCGNEVFFDSTVCVSCGARLGFLPDRFEMTALTGEAPLRPIEMPDTALAFCGNAAHDACNWLVPAEDEADLCRACQHNRTIPDLTDPANLENWRKLEHAKRYLFYSLMRWGLPIPTLTDETPYGLAFDFKAYATSPDGSDEPVITGHSDGIITINVAEGDDAEREKRRAEMGEPYRTAVGHFRHEIAHFYWDLLVRDGGKVEPFRALFGDETDDYAAALRRHYEQGPRADWANAYISAYATAHPWEDFAETWAHYMHMVDSLETARAFGLTLRQPAGAEASSPIAKVTFDPYTAPDVEALVAAWVPVTIALNSVNRSMGQPDVYPFVLSAPVVEKLGFIHEIIREARTQ